MTGKPAVEYDADEGAVYVRLSGAAISWTKAVDDNRLVDYSADGAVTGFEFLNVSEGIDLSGLPLRTQIESLIRDSGVPVRITAAR